jgi:hypothetical protein
MNLKKKTWGVADVVQQINNAARECRSPYNDGFTGWYVKQDLYQMKFILDEALKNCPDFGTMEQEWLTEQEQKRIIKILKS